MLISKIDQLLCIFLCTYLKENRWCYFTNWRQKILARSHTKFGYDQENKSYFAYEKDIGAIYFSEKYRHLRLYSRGLSTRLEKLARDYFIDDINFSDGDTVIDCGANIGELGRYLIWKGYKVNYIAFEPSVNEFEKIHLNTQTKHAYNFGLFDKSELITFYRSSETADSSFIEPSLYTERLQMYVKRLDTINIPNKIKLLKLEAEGAEPEVIWGAEGVLKNIEYISADLGFERGVHQESTELEVSSILKREGFKAVSKNSDRLTVLFRRIQP